MLTIIILTGIAIIALCIGFFEIKLPFLEKKNNLSEKKGGNSPERANEAFYRTVRMENWLHTIEHRRTSDIASGS